MMALTARRIVVPANADRFKVRVRLTGHPPPLQQISDQIRTSTGMTFGRGAHRLPVGWRGANPPPASVAVAAPAEEPAPEASVSEEAQMASVMRALVLTADAGTFLPRRADLARSLDVPAWDTMARMASAVSAVLHKLVRRRKIAMISGSLHEHRGEMVIRLAECGRVIRTAGAPAHWKDPVL